MNKVQLIGRLTKDPELRYTKSNIAVANYTLAINTGYGEKVQTDFINITTWGKGGEFVKNYLKKGQAIAIVGRLRSNSYEDKDGNKRYMTEVVTEDIEFVGNKKQEEKETTESFVPEYQYDIETEEDELPF